MPNHQIDVAAALMGGEQLLYDVSDTTHEALLAVPGRVAVFKSVSILLKLFTCVINDAINDAYLLASF